MTGAERRYRWLMVVYIFSASVAVAVASFPALLCRAGSAVLLVGVLHMMWQSCRALRKGLEEQGRVRRSALFYAPFLVGTNLIWMGLSLPVDPVSKALADCAFLSATVILLTVLYLYNHRVLNALSDLSHLGNNPHSEAR